MKEPLHAEIDAEKKTAFKIKCVTKNIAMNAVLESLIDDVLTDKWDKWDSLRSRC